MNQASFQQFAITPKQKLLVGFLAFVLLLVVWRNTGSQPASAFEGRPELVDERVQVVSESSQSAFQDVVRQMNALKKLDLTGPMTQSSIHIRDLLAFNPFRGPRQGITPGQNGIQAHGRDQVHQKNSLSESSETGSQLVGPSPDRDERIIALETSNTPLGQVGAIITGGDRPAVLINDQIYFEDETVRDSFRIRRILPDRIIVESILPE